MELWARRVTEYRELSGLFCRSLEDKNVGAVWMMQAWLVRFQREPKILPGLCEKNLWCLVSEAEESVRFRIDQQH